MFISDEKYIYCYLYYKNKHRIMRRFAWSLGLIAFFEWLLRDRGRKKPPFCIV